MPSIYPDGDPFIRDHWRTLIVVVVVGLFIMLTIVGGPGWCR